MAWDEVGEDEGTGIVHIAPGCGAEDYQLGKALGLPVIGPIDEDGRYFAGFDWLTGLEAPAVAERIVDDLERRGFFYHLEPYSHRYPHCWRCNTPLLFRLVDEWFISMGQVYDEPRGPADEGAGRREPALPDHGRRRPASGGSRSSATTASSTGSATCTTG